MKHTNWLVLSILAVMNVGATQSIRGPVDPLKELMIVDRLVVEDARTNPGGPWHFGTVMRNLLPPEATGQQVSDFVVTWLEEWEKVTQVNGFAVTPRPFIRDSLICPWLNASTGGTDCTGVLDMKKAPFRLLAITNRIDVKKGNGAGEGRLTYAVLDAPTEHPNDPAEFAREFTVLLNYNLPVLETKDAVAWAKQWHALSDLPCADGNCAEYLTSLNGITDGFLQGAHFVEMHTNEFALGSPWELREFVLAPTSRGTRMVQSVLNKTPAMELNNSPQLIQWAEANQAAILNETHSLPKALLGGMSHQSFGNEHKWKLDSLPENVRVNFSKNTCNGCHREDFAVTPSVDGFYHISPLRPAGTDRLSPWLLNTELPRRVTFIENLLAGN